MISTGMPDMLGTHVNTPSRGGQNTDKGSDSFYCPMEMFKNFKNQVKIYDD